MTATKRRIGVIGVVAALTLLATGCWPQPGAGPDRRAYNPYESELTIDNVSTMFWTWSVGLPDGVSEPAVSGDSVYVTSGFNVYAFGRASGAGRWTRSIDPTLPAELRSLGAPAVRTDTGVVSVRAHRYQGRGFSDDDLLDLDGDTGATIGSWSASPIGESSIRGTAQRGAKVASSGSFYFGSGGDLVQEIQVLDRDSGEVWGGVATRDGMPTLGTSALYLTDETSVSAYDVTEPCPVIPEAPEVRACQPIWTVTLDGAAQPVVIGEDPSTLYVGTRAGTLYALHAATGATAWTAPIGSSISQSPALANGVLYVPTDGGTIAALPAAGCESATCPVSWRGAASAGVTAQPAVAGGVVYAGSSDGTVSAFAAAGCGTATCSPVWTSSATGFGGDTGRVHGLAVAIGSLYVSRDDGLSRYTT